MHSPKLRTPLYSLYIPYFPPIKCVRIENIQYIPYSHTSGNAYNNAYPPPPPPKNIFSHSCEKMVTVVVNTKNSRVPGVSHTPKNIPPRNRADMTQLENELIK